MHSFRHTANQEETMAKRIKLGDESLIRLLYSYPNNANEVGFLNQTLEQTIETWLKSSISRDGLKLTASVSIQGGQVHLNLSGADETAYAARFRGNRPTSAGQDIGAADPGSCRRPRR